MREAKQQGQLKEHVGTRRLAHNVRAYCKYVYCFAVTRRIIARVWAWWTSLRAGRGLSTQKWGLHFFSGQSSGPGTWPLKRDENQGGESFEQGRETTPNEQTIATLYGGVFVSTTVASWCQACETLAAEARQTHPVDYAGRRPFLLVLPKTPTYRNYSFHCGLKRIHLAHRRSWFG